MEKDSLEGVSEYSDIDLEEIRETIIGYTKPKKIDLEKEPRIKKLWDEWDKLEEKNDLEGMLRCVNSILDIDNNNKTALHNKGCTFCDLFEYEKALECFHKLTEINPKYTVAWYNKGVTLTHLDRHQDAIECYDKAIKLNPKDAGSWINKAHRLNQIGKNEECIKLMDEALEFITDDDDVVRCLINKGVAFSILKNSKESLKYYKQASEIKPTNTLALNNMADSLQKLGRLDEALEIIKKVLKMNSKKWLYWETKGEILQKLGRVDEAKECFDMEIKLKTIHY